MRKEMEKVVKYDFVDLGLSVKWGNKNVGSDKMEGYGKYFSWNELVYEKEVDWVDYCGEDDVEVLRGSKMPTEEEIDELINKCSWNWSLGSRPLTPSASDRP